MVYDPNNPQANVPTAQNVGNAAAKRGLAGQATFGGRTGTGGGSFSQRMPAGANIAAGQQGAATAAPAAGARQAPQGLRDAFAASRAANPQGIGSRGFTPGSMAGRMPTLTPEQQASVQAANQQRRAGMGFAKGGAVPNLPKPAKNPNKNAKLYKLGGIVK